MFEIIGSVLGGLLGGGGSEQSQTSNQIDPRLGKYVYGENGTGGLLSDVQKLYQQQLSQGGLNALQRSGLESQRQTLMSPQYTQGYDAMRSMGLGLMGGGVAQNPFTNASANMPSSNQGAVRPNTNLQYTPMSYTQNAALTGGNAPIPSVSEYQQSSQAQAPQAQTVDQIIDDYMRANRLGKYAYQDSVADGAGQ